MVAFPIDAQQWFQGATLAQYILTMQANQQELQRRYDSVRLSAAEIDRLPEPDCAIRIAALSEEWCVDCLMTLPIMNCIAAALPNAEMRVFSRSKWPVLKEYFNQRGIMAIPTYAILNEKMEELAVFVERPQFVHQKLAEWKATHPETETIRRSATLSSEEKSARLSQIRRDLQIEMEGWYEQNCQTAMVDEVAALLTAVRSSQQINV